MLSCYQLSSGIEARDAPLYKLPDNLSVPQRNYMSEGIADVDQYHAFRWGLVTEEAAVRYQGRCCIPAR
jgi:hypothetical protein